MSKHELFVSAVKWFVLKDFYLDLSGLEPHQTAIRYLPASGRKPSPARKLRRCRTQKRNAGGEFKLEK